MKKYLFKRLLSLFPTMLGVSLITFCLVCLTPGDPAEILMRQSGVVPTSEAAKAFRVELGLDAPFYIQYARWLWRVIHFDLGISFHSGKPVMEELIDRFPATLELALASFIFMLAISVPTGILSAIWKNSFLDHLLRIISSLFVSLPSFWLGLLLIYFLSVKLKIFPVMGKGSMMHLILPAVTLGLAITGVYGRMLRASVLEVLSCDYIKLAHAKGLTLWEIILGHVLKNALLPLVTLWGMSFGHLLGGAVIVETIFAWPGTGQLAVNAIFNRDYPVIQGYVIFMAVIFVAVNLFVDIAYRFFDPRIRLGFDN